MTTQQSPTTEPLSSVRPSFGRYLLRVLLALSLIYYAALMLDLVLHPSGAGIGVSGFGVVEATAERYIAALIGTGTIIVGVFIIRRVPGNLVGPLLIIWGAGYTGYETRVDYGSPLFTSLTHLIFLIFTQGFAFPALIVLLLIFPTGHFYPRWIAPWVVLYGLIYEIVGILYIMAQSPSPSISELGAVSLPINPLFVPSLAPYYPLLNGAISNIFSGLGLVAAVVSLILRYRAASIRERQQIKWFVWVTCLVVVLLIIDFLVPSGPNSSLLSSPLVIGYLMFFYALLGAFPAIAIGLAILRSRLWDIDILINRTLVYGSLTALLVGLYVGLILAFQALVHAITGNLSQQPLVIVASTLVIAALFQPLRRRLQNIIDHRFYRRKYDAAKIVATFSSTLRQEVDLDTLREHLLAVVQETMQPSHISLWLRKPEQDKSGTPWEANRLATSHDSLLPSINQQKENIS